MDRKHEIVILRRVSEFLPIQDALNLLLLNKNLNTNLPNNEFYRYVSWLMFTNIVQINYEDDHLGKISDYLGFEIKSYEDLFNSLKRSYNLIKNPCGSEGFKH